MSYDGGGWTMFLSTSKQSYNGICSVEGYVAPNSVTYMPIGLVKTLAANSSQIHIRVSGEQASDSITSKVGTTPITNLANGKILNLYPTYNLNDWIGPKANNPMLASDPAYYYMVTHDYPELWWSNNNSTGLELGSCVGYWNNVMGKSFEAYIK